MYAPAQLLNNIGQKSSSGKCRRDLLTALLISAKPVCEQF